MYGYEPCFPCMPVSYCSDVLPFSNVLRMSVWRQDGDQVDWAKAQCETSSTVGGSWIGFMHGGLYYQIYHHLFPRICHVHYPTIKPIIQEVRHIIDESAEVLVSISY